MSVSVPVSKEECCGCAGCVEVCPVGAISMAADEKGFTYPSVDESKCTGCGLCRKKCGFFNAVKDERELIASYVAKHKNTDIRMNSRSGGVFVVISDHILSQGGVVYGCVLDENGEAVHVRAQTPEERDKMCKSKYVQSDTSGVYAEVLKDLRDGKKVLFSGTGCQTDGLLAMLRAKNINTDNLYTMDIVCHGVPSPLIYSDYLAWIEKKYGGKPENFQFRDKELTGWEGHVESFTVNGKKHKRENFKKIFGSALCVRPSCYNCKYALVNRTSDITIADAWKIKQALPEFNDNRGVSLVLIHSEKGRELFECAREKCELEQVDIGDFMQLHLEKPTEPHGSVEGFWNEYFSHGFEGVLKRYGTCSAGHRAKAAAKYKIKKLLKSKDFYLP